MNKRLFISHASENKQPFVRDLASALKSKNVDVWYDEYEIKPGMSIRESVDLGLASCDAGLIILSPNYFKKKWTIWELNSYMQRMLSGSAQLIPVCYNITHNELLKISPSLSDIFSISSKESITVIVQKVCDVLYPRKPVLIETRELLNSFELHEDFGADDTNIDWVDDVFRKSLALIQAEAENEELYLQLLQARTNALLCRVQNRVDRKKLMASGIPLSVSKSILENIEFFRTLAISFTQELAEGRDRIDLLDITIRELEIWSNENASRLMESVPEQSSLDDIRRDWISGISLSIIINSEQSADTISKDYYGFTLPWVIHAISQMFDSEVEQDIVQIYSSLAMFVELGLPDETATSIYMAGVRSRSAALELSASDIFQSKTVAEIKQILLDISSQENNFSDKSRVWINLLSEFYKAQKPKTISFSDLHGKEMDFHKNYILVKRMESIS